MQTEAKLIKLVLGLHCHTGLQKIHICMHVVYEVCDTDHEGRLNFVKFFLQ